MTRLLLVLVLLALVGCSAELHEDVIAHRRALVELLEVTTAAPGVDPAVVTWRLRAAERTLRTLEDETRPPRGAEAWPPPPMFLGQ